MLVSSHQHRSGLGAAQWQRYREVVSRRHGGGRYTIYLRPDGAPGSLPRGLGNSQFRRSLGAITAQEGSVLATAASVGTTVATASAIGAWAGPVGAAAGAIVGIIAGLFEASAARAKGAKEENEAINQYLPAWDQSLAAIFQQANAGIITPAEAISACQSLMPYWWQAAAQFRGLPGVADASNGGANCGTYIPGQTTACSPTGGPGCTKSCTAFCCIGCYDLAPSVAYAIYLFGLPQGGQLNVCTVYASKYGASQRASYTLTYTPPAPGTTAGAAASAVSAASGLLSGSGSLSSSSLLEILALVAGGFLLYEYL
jgi:hypothetical protein